MRIRELRLGRGWSQERLAELSGLSVRTIQRIENGHVPGPASMTALAGAFGLEVDQLASAAGASQPPESFPEAIRTCLRKYAEFDGRARRHEYWWFVLFVALAVSIAALVHEIVGGIVLLLVVIPVLAAGTRRLRDAGHSGWWQLFGLVPFGVVIPLFLLALRSTVPTEPGPTV